MDATTTLRVGVVGVLGLCGLGLLAGCGAGRGGQAAPVSAPSGGTTASYDGAGYAAAPSAGYSAPSNLPPVPPSPAPAPPPVSDLSAETSVAPSAPPATWRPEPAPTDRPGLGTEWGESRESRITEVSFLRADPERPFAVAQLFYNDWSGVQALAAYHGGPRFHDFGAAGGAITVSIRGAGGEPLDAVAVGGRTYVIGQEGERYSIFVENHTPRSFETVATVDGLDVMNGKPGSFDNRGYVLGPWQNLEIDGFRQSEDAVAAFRFSKVRDSYAAGRGQARNVGVIGVAFFAERGDDWSSAELRTRDTASPFPRDPRFAPPPR